MGEDLRQDSKKVWKAKMSMFDIVRTKHDAVYVIAKMHKASIVDM